MPPGIYKHQPHTEEWKRNANRYNGLYNRVSFNGQFLGLPDLSDNKIIMTNLQELKKIRKYCLAKYSVAHLPFRMSRVQAWLEDIDEIKNEEWLKAIEALKVEATRKQIQLNNSKI